LARVRGLDPMSAPSTSHEASEESAAASASLLAPRVHVRILFERLADRKVLRPGDVTGVMIAQEDGPLRHRLRYVTTSSKTTGRRPALRSAPDVRTGIQRRRQDPVDGAGNWKLPLDLVPPRAFAAHGHHDSFAAKPQQHFPHTAV